MRKWCQADSKKGMTSLTFTSNRWERSLSKCFVWMKQEYVNIISLKTEYVICNSLTGNGWNNYHDDFICVSPAPKLSQLSVFGEICVISQADYIQCVMCKLKRMREKERENANESVYVRTHPDIVVMGLLITSHSILFVAFVLIWWICAVATVEKRTHLQPKHTRIPQNYLVKWVRNVLPLTASAVY